MHHAIAYLELNNDPEAVSTGITTGVGAKTAADDLVNRRPQLMEWAIGKSYDLYRRRHRQAHSAGREDLLGRAHPRRR